MTAVLPRKPTPKIPPNIKANDRTTQILVCIRNPSCRKFSPYCERRCSTNLGDRSWDRLWEVTVSGLECLFPFRSRCPVPFSPDGRLRRLPRHNSSAYFRLHELVLTERHMHNTEFLTAGFL